VADSDTALVLPSPILDRWKRWDMGAYHRVSDYWRTVAREDPFFGAVFMCIELVFGGGTVVRIARETIKTTSSLDSTVYVWHQGLIDEPEISTAIDIGNPAASARTLSFSLPSKVANPSDILARGGMLAGVAEVSLQKAGGDYEKRLVLMRGDMSGGVTFGADEEQLAIQIVDPRETQSLKVPKYSVTTDRWPLAQESAIGMRYPVVINGYPKVPCQRVLDDHGATGLYFLACDGGRDLKVDATYVNGEVAAGGYAPATETDTRDALGADVKVIDFSASAGPWEDNDAVYVDLSPKTTTPKLSPIRIVQKLLQGYTALGNLGLNPDLFSFADVRMPGYPPKVLVNASGADAVEVLDWIESTFLNSFPMIHMMYEGRGLGPVVVDRRVGPGGANIHGRLTGGQAPLLERLTGFVETPKSSLYNVFELRYAFNAQDNSYGGVVERSPTNSRACQISEAMCGGKRVADTLDSPFIHTKRQADYVIDWMVAHYSLPAYDVEWACLPSLVTRYRPGMNIVYTDDKIAAFTACPATVLGFTYSRGGKSSIKLRVWHPYWRQMLLGGA
jgi:hypothetical protein